MLLTDVSFDFVRSEIAGVSADAWRHVCELFSSMEAEARAWLDRERVAAVDQLFRCYIEARYQGQNFEVIVPMAGVNADGMAAFIEAFHAAHAREYGYDVRERSVEIVNCRLQAVGRVHKAPLRQVEALDGVPEPMGQRSIYHGAQHGWIDTRVYARSRLGARASIAGPAVIEEMSSTTLLAPGQEAKIDAIGNIVIRIES
jgi:N-methylhydantoinase A